MDGLLLQKPEKEAAGQKKAENFIRMDRIAPYVRYVNYKIFEGGTLLPERIIYDHELIYLSLIHISNALKAANTGGNASACVLPAAFS